MYFASDNWAGAHRSIAERLLRESDGFAAAYGASDLDRRVERRFAEVFEREVAVLFVGTGTAANSLSLASVQRPGGITFCHSEAHVIADECGAPDFFSGARLLGVPGAEGKIDPARLSAKIAAFPQTAVQHGRATAVTITQARKPERSTRSRRSTRSLRSPERTSCPSIWTARALPMPSSPLVSARPR